MPETNTAGTEVIQTPPLTLNQAIGEHFGGKKITPPAKTEDGSLTNTDTAKPDKEAAEKAAALEKEQAEEKLLNESVTKFLEKKGKFKSYEDIEKLSTDYEQTKAEYEKVKNTPPKVEFKNALLNRLYELDQRDVPIDTDLLTLQVKNYDKMDDVQIKKEAMRLKEENRNLSDAALEAKLHKEYAYNDWKDKPKEELTPEDEANMEIFFSDAKIDKAALLKMKEERLLLKQPTADEVAKAQSDVETRKANNQKAKQEWERNVDDVIAVKSSKLEVPVEYKDVEGKLITDNFVFEYPKEDIKLMSDIMKQMPVSGESFWNQFKDDKGNINHNEVFETILLKKNLPNIIANAKRDGIAIGQAMEVAIKKNINMKPADGTPPPNVAKTEADRMKEGLQKSMNKNK